MTRPEEGQAPRRKVLITGAAGHIGRYLLADFAGRYDVRAFDRVTLDGPWESVTGDLADPAALLRAMRGVDVVVHLAATRQEAPFVEDLVPNNIIGLYNTFEAAREAGVRRIVFASSGQTVAAYPKGQRITINDPPRPSSLYGVTKVFGETLGRFYHDRYGLEFVALRIGWFLPPGDERLGHGRSIWLSPSNAMRLFQAAIEKPGIGYAIALRIGWFLPPGDERLGHGRSIWLSPSNAMRLFQAAIEKPGIGYAIVFGTSVPKEERLSQSEAQALLGYEPEEEPAEAAL